VAAEAESLAGCEKPLWHGGNSIVRTSRTTGEQRAGSSKGPAFSPAQPRRLLHPPTLSLPRQTLRPRTRLFPNKAAVSEEPKAYASVRWASERGKNAAGGLFQYSARH